MAKVLLNFLFYYFDSFKSTNTCACINFLKAEVVFPFINKVFAPLMQMILIVLSSS